MGECTVEQKPLFVPRGHTLLVVLFTCLILYSLISLQLLEKHVDVLCNAVKHSSLLPSAEDRLCMLSGAGAGTWGGHVPQTAAGRSSSHG